VTDEKAKAAWNEAVSRGHRARTSGDLAAALQGYNAALAIEPDDVNILFYRGLTNFDLANYRAAVADFSGVIRLSLTWPSGFIKRGHAYLAMKDFDRAIADYSETIRMAPRLAPLYYNRADAYLAMRDTDKANADLRKAAELDVEQSRRP
jgi:tetratricopeptide (TPR) repeat protein